MTDGNLLLSQDDTVVIRPPLPEIQDHRRIPKILTPGSRSLASLIALLLAAIFIADLETNQSLHIGVLYNVAIALTLWAWRPRWVIAVTAVSVLLRLLAPSLQAHIGVKMPRDELFNLTVGMFVQTLTGALIWRQVRVQHQLEKEERQVRAQASALERALLETQQAVQEAESATARERTALLHEVEARRRERQAYRALERVKDLSAALSRAVLPPIPAQVAGGRLHLSARYAPAERDIQIGGDFYDLLTLDEAETRYGFVIGDVAGHGVEAAAQTALVTSTLRACAFESADGPASVLSRTARMLEGQLESFVSLFYGVYNAETSTLTYACAGHEPPLLIDAAGVTHPLRPTGPILGVGLFLFREVCLSLHSGETLVFFTDGLTEARRESGEMLDWDGLAAMVAHQAQNTTDVESLADGILGEVRAWAGQRRLTDDMALLIVRVT